MTVRLENPVQLHSPQSYTHVVTAIGSRMIFIAGQAADDIDGNLVAPGDLAGQAHQAFGNLGRALASVGARPDQVARIGIYVVGHRPEYLPLISEARMSEFGEHKPTDTLLGVETLAEPGYLIEVDAIAVVE